MRKIFTPAVGALKSAQGRIIAGLTLLALTVWLCEPTVTGIWNWEAVAAFSAAFVAWFFGCLPDHADGGELTPPTRPAASEHDRQLFERFREIFSEAERQFLRHHDFGGTFNWHNLDGMRAVADGWHGAEFEFDDPDLQASFVVVLQK